MLLSTPIAFGFGVLWIFRAADPNGDLFGQILIVFALLLALSLFSFSPSFRKFAYFRSSFAILTIGSLLFMQVAPSILLNIDRSRSFYVLGWVKFGEIRTTDDILDLSRVVSAERKNPEAIYMRIVEQENRGLIKSSPQGQYSLTRSGQFFFQWSDFLASMFQLNGWKNNRR